MSMVFQLRMIGTEDEVFLRDYEVPYTMNLLDFDHFICGDLGYDALNMTSFFRSNERWEKEQEFTLMDVGGEVPGAPVPMEQVTLGQILWENHDRLIYVFDQFGDRCLFLELMGTIKRQDGVEYPRVALSAGDPPRQFELETIASATGDSIFEAAMDDFYDFEGDDLYDDDF